MCRVHRVPICFLFPQKSGAKVEVRKDMETKTNRVNGNALSLFSLDHHYHRDFYHLPLALKKVLAKRGLRQVERHQREKRHHKIEDHFPTQKKQYKWEMHG